MTQNTGHKTNSLAENPKVSKTLKKKTVIQEIRLTVIIMKRLK